MTSLRLVIALLAASFTFACSEATPPPEELPPLTENDKDDNPADPDDPDDPDDPEEPEEPEEPVNPNCNPSNCDGCCNGDLCVEGTDDDACGFGGEICAACGEDFLCSEEQVCSLDPLLTWVLIAKDGSVSPTTLAGGDWDGDGNLPDPYVKLTSDAWWYEYTTYDDGNTLTPVWDYAVLWNLYTINLLDPMEVSVYDKDGNADDFMGACDLQLTEEQLISGEEVVIECERDQVSDVAGWTITVYALPMDEYWNY